MLKRFTLLLFVLLLGVNIIGAQDDTATFCGDLVAEDCDLLVQSSLAMADVHSLMIDFTLNFEMGGDFGMGSESLAFGLNGEGVFSADFATMDGLEDLPLDQMMMALVKGFETDTKMEIVLPEDLSSGMPELVFDIVMVNGVIYLDTAPFMGGVEPMWMGVDLVLFMDTYMEEIMGQLDMEEMDTEALDVEGMEALESLSDLATIVRLEDGEVAGQAVAVFETNYDFATIFTSETFRDMYGELMTGAFEAQGLTMADLGMNVEDFLDVMGLMFKDTTFSIVQWIGLDDYYSYHNALYMEMEIDLNLLAAAMGEQPDPNLTEPLVMVVDGELNMSKFNNDFGIAAPEGATLIDPMTMLGADF